MNALKKKLNKSNGFTLVEMLIVVAIIAILIAISIPLINNALEKSRDATDNANMRAAKAEATLLLMGMAEDADGEVIDLPSTTASTTYYYDAVKGALTDADNKPEVGYGQCTRNHGSDDDNPFASVEGVTGPNVGKVIKVVYNPTATNNKTITISWE